MTIELIGMLAAVLTTASFAPQAIQVLRTKETGAISLVMYIMFTTGVLTWFIYGLFIGSLPVIIANAVTLLLAGLILFLKVNSLLPRDWAGRARNVLFSPLPRL
ncbi:glutathione synthetase [Parvularcula flava]|uniref:Glutathione synthetase n=1 Tax=Aquisalinus luteolus TaxID=1566827 RepID=A0A8J3A0F3_9PROT|nr:SemiSWEET transporter [Aquisalinus luteolus]NHK26546.1 glutathione synthetase [Aquisalinus luteolus]GGH92667.1 sugar transporter SemiSWEET [Aquisalinus luteolus]